MLAAKLKGLNVLQREPPHSAHHAASTHCLQTLTEHLTACNKCRNAKVQKGNSCRHPARNVRHSASWAGSP